MSVAWGGQPPGMPAGAAHWGSGDIGIAGAAILAASGAGQHGPGPLVNDITAGADDAALFRWRILSRPATGTLTASEDGWLQLAGVTDGSYAFTYELTRNNVVLTDADTGLPYMTGTVAVGEVAVAALAGILAVTDTAADVVSMTGSIAAPVVAAITGTLAVVDAGTDTVSIVASIAPVVGKRVRLYLTTDGKKPARNLAGLSGAFFDQPLQHLLQAPSVTFSGKATDADGVLEIDVSASALAVGAVGYLVEGTAAGNPAGDHAGWHGPVTVEAA